MNFKSLILTGCFLFSIVGCGNSEGHQEYCEVTFKNYDATTLFYTSVKYGENAVYQGETPTRPDDSQHSYTFTGWDKPLENIKINTTFIAQYQAGELARQVRFLDASDNVIYSETVLNGGTATFKGEVPTKATDLDYIYTFKEWDKPLTNITTNTDFRPVFDTEFNCKAISLSFYPSGGYKVFQNSSFDEAHTNYLKNQVIISELNVGVMVDDTTYVSTEVALSEATFDYSKVDLTKLGKYDFSVSCRGQTISKEVEVVVNLSDKAIEQSIYGDGYDPNFFPCNSIDVIEGGYAVFNNNLFEAYSYSLNENSIKMRNLEKHCDVIYTVIPKSGNTKTFTAYDFKETAVVKSFSIESESYLPMTLDVFNNLEDYPNSLGRLTVHFDDRDMSIGVYFHYQGTTIDILVPFFDHALTINGDILNY